MKVLVVCSGNMPNFDVQLHQAFIYDQVLALRALNPNIEIDFFFIKGKGISGYLQNLSRLKHTLLQNKYDLIHAHFALSGLLAGLQHKVPVVTTFHGSDINIPKLRVLSALAMMMSKKVIYVSHALNQKALFRNDNKDQVIPCGLDLSIFKPYSHLEPHHLQPLQHLKPLQPSTKHILFASSFTNPVKNYPLLQAALKLMDASNIVVHELKNMCRVEVAEMMNKVDLCVMTSFTEGSPQFIKEAMACNCPIVSTDVGDVKEIIGETEGCYIIDFDHVELAIKIQLVLANSIRTNGRLGVLNLDNNAISAEIMKIYLSIN